MHTIFVLWKKEKVGRVLHETCMLPTVSSSSNNLNAFKISSFESFSLWETRKTTSPDLYELNMRQVGTYFIFV